MTDKRAEQIKACKDLIEMYSQMMIEKQSLIRYHSGRSEVEASLYKVYKAHKEAYEKQLEELTGGK